MHPMQTIIASKPVVATNIHTHHGMTSWGGATGGATGGEAGLGGETIGDAALQVTSASIVSTPLQVPLQSIQALTYRGSFVTLNSAK